MGRVTEEDGDDDDASGAGEEGVLVTDSVTTLFPSYHNRLQLVGSFGHNSVKTLLQSYPYRLQLVLSLHSVNRLPVCSARWRKSYPQWFTATIRLLVAN